MLIRSAAIIVKLTLKHWLHFGQLCESIEPFIVLASICGVEDTSSDYILVNILSINATNVDIIAICA